MPSRLAMGVIRSCRKRDYDPKRPKKVQRVCLYTASAPRRLLGRHPDKPSAIRQEYAIKMRQRGD